VTTTPRVRPASEAQRAERSDANHGEPTLDFAAEAPYDAYVHASTLHGLQQPISDDPGEMSFLMISQIMELYFGLICYELREAARVLDTDDVWGALAPLRRTALHLTGLNAAWLGMRWMTPADFNRFRDQLGDASGFQSATYRRMEFLLGIKSPTVIRPFRRQGRIYTELVAALRAPSLYDAVLALLHRRDPGVPSAVLARDPTAEPEIDPDVEAAWVRVYADPRTDHDLYVLGEALVDIAEEFGDWRYKHLRAVARTMGAKPGSGGSSGMAWLQRSMAKLVFPELWSARTFM